ncbi:hypothetical protein L596_030624 [Steinernema carpocapsae]|uniref:Uncharacterized protein n=1 Tax=Steinernema carpocapsae TaxID=34508 RepID=A0A4U5LPY9_STECR|nr:hypothetical protein L596_030624 [Steinernema carpocapsae]
MELLGCSTLLFVLLLSSAVGTPGGSRSNDAELQELPSLDGSTTLLPEAFENNFDHLSLPGAVRLNPDDAIFYRLKRNLKSWTHCNKCTERLCKMWFCRN